MDDKTVVTLPMVMGAQHMVTMMVGSHTAAMPVIMHGEAMPTVMMDDNAIVTMPMVLDARAVKLTMVADNTMVTMPMVTDAWTMMITVAMVMALGRCPHACSQDDRCNGGRCNGHAGEDVPTNRAQRT